MKIKLMLHYAMSFILACLVILSINVLLMRNNLYNAGVIYNYHPEEIVREFESYLILSADNKVGVTPKGLDLLQANNIGLQILNEKNEEIFSYHKPDYVPTSYSNVTLINLYENEESTLFVGEETLGGRSYTYLLFLDGTKVRRVIYEYNVALIKEAHQFPVVILINIVLIISISFIYTLAITKPINRIVAKILGLSKGNYLSDMSKQGIYSEVENSLNQLGKQLKRNEEEHKQLEELREEWISNISHDIKTPLTSIMGNAEIMADTEYVLDESMRLKCGNTIIKKSQYIKNLVDELNLSARLKNNTIMLKKNRINIVSLIRHVIIDIMNDSKYQSSQISFTYSSEAIYLDVDEQLIQRVFINIIMNAFVHNRNKVEVNVKIEETNCGKVKISIQDNGKGISEEELNNIFKRYYRGTNTSKIEGSGLGMAISNDIVRIHDGEIIATSSLGEGLKIIIIL